MKSHSGFSLVELAMVLFIISLLLGGLLVPLATQLDTRKRNEAQEQLERIKEALIGYAIVNGKLPCFTTQTDPTDPLYGIEDSPCIPAGLEFGDPAEAPCTDADPNDGVRDTPCDGILPWKTLGLTSGLDPWGTERQTEDDRWTGYWRYRVDGAFHSIFALNNAPTSNISIFELNTTTSLPGTPIYISKVSPTETPVALVYSTGANGLEDGLNSGIYEQINPTYEAGPPSDLDRDNDGITEDEEAESFDDIVGWLTRPLLFNRLVTAGTLP